MDHQTQTQAIPTPNGNVVIHIGASPTGAVHSEASGCCSYSTPPGPGNKSTVHYLSLGVLVSGSFAALVMFLLIAPFDDWSTAPKTTNLIACLLGMATSSILLRTTGRSTSLYSSCALLYAVVGALLLTTVVIWLANENMAVTPLILLASPSVVCSTFSLVCSVVTFKTACALNMNGRVPDESAVGVAETQQQAA